MTLRSWNFAAFFAAAVAMACDGMNSPPAPTALHNPTTTSGAVAQMAAPAAQHAVSIFDACDPETFNAALGPGTCSRSGGITFQNFVALLTRHHSVGAWHFAPSEVTMRVGEQLVAN